MNWENIEEESKLEKYHDMMNSASVIKGMAELLIEEETVPERIDQLSAIISSVDKVAEQLWISQRNSKK